MELSAIFKCLSDPQRARVLNLLREGPLCVCHLQEILGEGQVKVSKQLAYLKQQGLVAGKREGNWMIHRLVEPVPALLVVNLEAIRANPQAYPEFRDDLVARAKVVDRLSSCDGAGPQAVLSGSAAAAECC